MSRSKSYKSPSTLKRSNRRLLSFLIKKKTLKPVLSLSSPHSVSIPSLKPSLSLVTNLGASIPPLKPRILSIYRPQPVDVPPTKPPKPKLMIILTSSTCDTPDCQTRRRPCYGMYPQNQFMVIDGEMW